MSVLLYDEEILNKLRLWTTDSSIQIYTTEDTKTVFEVLGDQSGDKPIKLPIIVLRRKNGFTIKDTTKKLLVYDGKSIDLNESGAVQLNAIPISLEYQIDIYARKQSECEEIARNLIFNLIIFPALNIELPYYGKKYVHRSHIRLMSDVSDNSNVPERLHFGQFTRYSIGAVIPDAYMFDIRERENYQIVINGIENTSIDPSKLKGHTFSINVKTEK